MSVSDHLAVVATVTPGPDAGMVTVHKRAVGEVHAMRRLAVLFVPACDQAANAALHFRVALAAILRKIAEPGTAQPVLQLERNFLHAAELALAHPVTGRPLSFQAQLPEELELFLKQLTTGWTTQAPPSPAARGAGRERIQ